MNAGTFISATVGSIIGCLIRDWMHANVTPYFTSGKYREIFTRDFWMYLFFSMRVSVYLHSQYKNDAGFVTNRDWIMLHFKKVYRFNDYHLDRDYHPVMGIYSKTTKKSARKYFFYLWRNNLLNGFECTSIF